MKASATRRRNLHPLLRSFVAFTLLAGTAAAADMGQYNVVWNSPSKDQTGVMPIGNGDIAAGAWAIENGDLFLLLSKNDAFNYMGDLFKTGRVRVSLEPNPFKAGKPFRQTLDLPTGSILIEADGVSVRLWADANKPVYHIEIRSPKALSVTAHPEFWKRIDGCGHNGIGAHSGLPQDVKLERNGAILWYFPVGNHSVHAEDLKFYGIEADAAKDRFPDPYRFNTFGNLLESPSLKLKDGVLSGSGETFDIRIHALTTQTPDPEKWIEAIQRQAGEKMETSTDWQKHCAWWSKFWDRGWIVANDTAVPAEQRGKLNGEPTKDGKRTEADGAALVSQSYNFHRYLMATQSRGRIQTKFNGGLFTQPFQGKGAGNNSLSVQSVQQTDGKWFTHEDDRPWGRRFTYQNQRLLYWPLLASGDFDLMKPFFTYYNDLLPIRKAITKNWFGHDGAYYRDNIEPNGAERDSGGHPPKGPATAATRSWMSYYFTCGLETVAMMLDYVRFTGDTKFRDEALVPFARDILLFFDKHYQRDANGKLRLDPAQVLETWWVAVNPAPDVAGLRFCLDGLLAMKAGAAQDQARWRKFRTEIPEIHLQIIDGKQAIAPAEKWESKNNFENGELYPVFPFRCFGLALGTGDLVAWTMQHRTWQNFFDCACWTQDQIHWACAGNATEAANGLVHRFRIASPMCRFPLYGREGPDSCPDFDHFGSGSVALQRMLLQEGEGKLLLFPAWPKNWDVSFKLHASRGTVVEGVYRDGKVQTLNVTPESRAREVVNCLQKP